MLPVSVFLLLRFLRFEDFFGTRACWVQMDYILFAWACFQVSFRIVFSIGILTGGDPKTRFREMLEQKVALPIPRWAHFEHSWPQGYQA